MKFDIKDSDSLLHSAMMLWYENKNNHSSSKEYKKYLKENELEDPYNNKGHLRPEYDTIRNDKGIYFFVDDNQEVVRIGKAVALRCRLFQYHNKDTTFDDMDYYDKLGLFISVKIIDDEIERTCYELEMIKKYQPKYNKQGKNK